MAGYEELTRQIGDQWVALLKRAEDVVDVVAQSAASARERVEVPQVEVPEQLTKLADGIADRVPSPSEIVEANFELTERLMAAQKALTLRALAASTAPAATED